MEIVKYCLRCEANRVVVKNGYRNGNQCYRCKECYYQFIDTKKKYSNEIKCMAVKFFDLGLSTRTIARILNIKSHTLIIYWNEKDLAHQSSKIVSEIKMKKIAQKLVKSFEMLKKYNEVLSSIRYIEMRMKSFNEIDIPFNEMSITQEKERLLQKIKYLEDSGKGAAFNEQCKLLQKITLYYAKLKTLDEITKTGYKSKAEYEEELKKLLAIKDNLKTKCTITEDGFNNIDKIIRVISYYL